MSLSPGSHIGAYEIVAPLGAGGMGEVYRAHDAKLGRDVALKLLPRDMAGDPEHRARMVREAKSVAALNHPNICTIYEAGEADGHIYIAMEVIDGESLSACLSRRALPPDELLRIGVQLAEGVAHAHDRGIVHRDLKGANVMVTPEGRVKILDFGLARPATAEDISELTNTRTASPLTAPHAVVGTLPYMSPEQLRAQPADTRSDVWALGIILYEMAARTRPFTGQTGFELSSAILREPPPQLPATVSPSLQSVIARCLEKEPARRYQRGAEVRAALDTLRSGTAAVTSGGGRRMWIAGSVAAITLAAAAVIWSNVGLRQATIRSIVVLPLENLAGDANEEYFVTGIHEALITDLARIGLQKVIAKPSADAYKGTKKPLREIGRELGVDGIVTGSVMRRGNRVQINAQLIRADTDAVVWANRYERTTDDVMSLQNDVVGAIAREVHATLSPEQTARLSKARPLNAAAHDAYLKGRSRFAAFVVTSDPKQFEAALTQFDDAVRLDPTYAPPHAAISVAYLTQLQMSVLSPKEAFPKARAEALTAIELDDTLPEGHSALGEVELWYGWEWGAANREIQRALQLNPDSPDALRASEIYLTLIARQPDEAARTSERILSVDPLNPFSRVQPSWVSFFSRRYDDSIRHARSLLELYPNQIMGPLFLASSYAVKRMPTEVGVECEKILKMLSGAFVMQPIGQCAWAYAAVGQSDQARRLLTRLEQAPEGTWVDPVVIAQVYGALGDRDRAMQWLQKGLRERSSLMVYLNAGPPWDPLRGDARFQALLRQMKFPD